MRRARTVLFLAAAGLAGCTAGQRAASISGVRFARPLPDGSPYAPRAALAVKGAPMLARDILAMTQEAFAAASRKSPMKRAPPFASPGQGR